MQAHDRQGPRRSKSSGTATTVGSLNKFFEQSKFVENKMDSDDRSRGAYSTMSRTRKKDSSALLKRSMSNDSNGTTELDAALETHSPKAALERKPSKLSSFLIDNAPTSKGDLETRSAFVPSTTKSKSGKKVIKVPKDTKLPENKEELIKLLQSLGQPTDKVKIKRKESVDRSRSKSRSRRGSEDRARSKSRGRRDDASSSTDRARSRSRARASEEGHDRPARSKSRTRKTEGERTRARSRARSRTRGDGEGPGSPPQPRPSGTRPSQTSPRRSSRTSPRQSPTRSPSGHRIGGATPKMPPRSKSVDPRMTATSSTVISSPTRTPKGKVVQNSIYRDENPQQRLSMHAPSLSPPLRSPPRTPPAPNATDKTPKIRNVRKMDSAPLRAMAGVRPPEKVDPYTRQSSLSRDSDEEEEPKGILRRSKLQQAGREHVSDHDATRVASPPRAHRLHRSDHKTTTERARSSSRGAGLRRQGSRKQVAERKSRSRSRRRSSSSQVEYDEEDIFTHYNWSTTRQDPNNVAKERKRLRDSIRDTPLFRAFSRMEKI